MSLSTIYPNINQWVSYGGTLQISPSTEGVVVSVGDAGGVPEDGYFYGASVDVALSETEQFVGSWLIQTKELLECLLSGDPAITDEEFLRVAGWPPARNPHYKTENA